MGGHREAAHRAWEVEKKLRRRVEALERRLEERGVELQAAEGQVAKAKDLLTRQARGFRKGKDVLSGIGLMSFSSSPSPRVLSFENREFAFAAREGHPPCQAF